MIDFNRLAKVVRVFSITRKYLRCSQKTESNVIILKNLWAKEIINHFKINLKIIGLPISQNTPSILVGNHISYLDIPILLHICPEISFVSKKEIKRWPIIGKVAQRAQTIFVERNIASSKNTAKSEITSSLLKKRQKIAIFPSGTTSIQPTSRWKKGVFEIAEYNDVWVQPFRIRYEPSRASAYIDDDNFLLHMYQLFDLKNIKVTLEFHEPVKISDHVLQCDYWKKWCEEP